MHSRIECRGHGHTTQCGLQYGNTVRRDSMGLIPFIQLAASTQPVVQVHQDLIVLMQTKHAGTLIVYFFHR